MNAWQQSLLGLACLVLLARALGPRIGQAHWRSPLLGFLLTLGLAGLLLKTPGAAAVLMQVGVVVDALQAATRAGTSFLFGAIGGGAAPYAIAHPEASFSLAFQALPVLIVLGALTRLLNYWGILPAVVRALALVLTRSLQLSGPVGLAATANIFLGMVEAPLFIQPYLQRLTRSEFFVLMVTGMATIAGTVFVLYAQILAPHIPGVAGHLLVASVLSVPAAISVALLMEPEYATPTSGALAVRDSASSSMDALVEGASAGLQMALQIGALLITFVALVHLCNQVLGLIPMGADQDLSLEGLLGLAMAPIAWLMGIPWAEAQTAGGLLGLKTVLNEFIAYLRLVELPEASLSARSELIMTYALCGFANIGSLAIMVGGLASLVPERRHEILDQGWRSVIAGTLATCITGAAVGVWIA